MPWSMMFCWGYVIECRHRQRDIAWGWLLAVTFRGPRVGRVLRGWVTDGPTEQRRQPCLRAPSKLVGDSLAGSAGWEFAPNCQIRYARGPTSKVANLAYCLRLSPQCRYSATGSGEPILLVKASRISEITTRWPRASADDHQARDPGLAWLAGWAG